MDEAQLMELSETEGVQQIIELTSDGKLEQIIHFDRTKFGTSSYLDGSKTLNTLKLDDPIQLCNEQIIESENNFDVLNLRQQNNRSIILQHDGTGREQNYVNHQQVRALYNRLAEASKEEGVQGTSYSEDNSSSRYYIWNMGEEQHAILRFSTYVDFKRALTEYESQTITKFILRNQSKQFTAPVCLHDILRNEKNSSDLPMIRWEFCAAKDFLPIPFMGIPYITVGKQVFQCHQGKDYNTNKKQQYELKKEILNQATRFQIKSRNKGPSKKLDCPVLFAVRKMYFFPEYPLQTDSKRNRALIAQKIRNRLSRIKLEVCSCQCVINEDNILTEKTSNNGLPGKLEYLTRLPPNADHNHDVHKAANFMKLQLKKHGSKGIEIIQNKKVVSMFSSFEIDNASRTAILKDSTKDHTPHFVSPFISTNEIETFTALKLLLPTIHRTNRVGVSVMMPTMY